MGWCYSIGYLLLLLMNLLFMNMLFIYMVLMYDPLLHELNWVIMCLCNNGVDGVDVSVVEYSENNDDLGDRGDFDCKRGRGRGLRGRGGNRGRCGSDRRHDSR
eukprot:488205_1